MQTMFFAGFGIGACSRTSLSMWERPPLTGGFRHAEGPSLISSTRPPGKDPEISMIRSVSTRPSRRAGSFANENVAYRIGGELYCGKAPGSPIDVFNGGPRTAGTLDRP